MKSLMRTFAVAGLLASFVNFAQAEDSSEPKKPWSVDLSTAFNSDYMFRGFNLYDGISIQPSVTANFDTGFGTISGNLWMHLSGEGDKQAQKFTEIDESITYSLELEPVTLKTGILWYTYPDGDDDIKDTSEVFASVGLDDSKWLPFALNPIFSVYEDYRVFDAWYYELGFSHTFECDCLGKGFSTVPYVTFGFASSAESEYADNGLEHVTIGTSFPLTTGDISVTPTLNYTFKVDDATVNEFWIGTTFGYSL